MVFLLTAQLFSRKKRNREVNGRALWHVCPWSMSASWLQDSGVISELKMDCSSLPWPTAGKKGWRPQLIGFVNYWGTAERWMQSDKTQSSLKSTEEFLKVIQMLLLTKTWSLAEGKARAIGDPWTCVGLMMHQLLCWGPTLLENLSPALLSQTPPQRVKSAKFSHT